MFHNYIFIVVNTLINKNLFTLHSVTQEKLKQSKQKTKN